jgi:hypothetical protein
LIIVLAGGCAPKYKLYGEPLTLDESQTVAVEKVLAEPASYDGKTMRLAGKIHDVCARKGCWITMTDGSETLRIKFNCPIKGRLVPLEAKGHPAVVEGAVKLGEISEEVARHYKEDAGAPAEEIEKIKGPQKALQMQSKGALIREDSGAAG